MRVKPILGDLDFMDQSFDDFIPSLLAIGIVDQVGYPQ